MKRLLAKIDFKKNKNKYLIIFAIVLLVALPLVISFGKYVLSRRGQYNYSFNGTPYNSEGLVLQDLDYTDSLVELVNPERGYYLSTDVTLDVGNHDQIVNSANTFKNNILDANYTLGLVNFNLYYYNSNNSIVSVLNLLNDYTEVFNNSGIKLIVKFYYSVEPTNFEYIYNHIETLKSYFYDNSDSIYAVELGFIGRNGEFSNSNFDTKEYRNSVISLTLNNTPSNMKVLLRNVGYYQDFIDSTEYVDMEYGLNTEILNNKLGFYDSTYAQSSTDGLFPSDDREYETKWVSYVNRYSMFGGYSNNSLSSKYDEMNKLHFNFLGGDYDANLGKYLGYRYVLVESKLPENIKQGSNLNISFSIDNVGYGTLIYKRNVEIILENNGKYYVTNTNIDPRTWMFGETSLNNLNLKVPQSLKTGTWNVYVRMPDNNLTYVDDNYYVKFANDGIYNDKLHANYIGSFEVLYNRNNTGEGFYQVNTIDDNSTALSDIYEVPRIVTVDGKITAENEWTLLDSVYTTDEIVYLYSDEDYLYVYINPTMSVDGANLYFAKDYNGEVYSIKVVDNKLYVDNDLVGDIDDYKKSTGLEYQISLRDMNIDSLNDIFGMKIEYLKDNAINKNYNFVILHDGVKTMIIDGKITTDYEWENSDRVYNVDGNYVYLYSDNNYLYLFMNGEEGVTKVDTLLSFSRDGVNYTIDLVNNKVYQYNNGLGNKICDAYGYAYDKGFEYKIKLSDLHINNYEDVRGIKTNYYNNEELIDNYEFTILDSSRTIYVDGNITNSSEWTANDRVFTNTTENLYLYSNNDYLYIYTDTDNYETNDITDIKIYFATDETGLNYSYYINNGEIYNSNDELIGSARSYIKSIGTEYQLDRSTMNIYDTDITGFKIVYNDEYEVSSIILRPGKRAMVLDGVITYSNEWIDDNKVYDQDNNRVYIFSDSEYLYLLNESDYLPVNLDIYLSTTNGSDYSYIINNSTLYGLENDVTNSIVSEELEHSNNGVEYKIPLSLLDISDYTNIKGMRFDYKDVYNNTNNLYAFGINVGYQAIYIDGKVTNSSEWSSKDLIYNDNHGKVYLFNDSKYLYIYNYSNLNTDDYEIGISTEITGLTYNYAIKNNSLYNVTGTNTTILEYGELIKDVLNYNDIGHEYKILLSDLDIVDSSDIRGLRFIFSNNDNILDDYSFVVGESSIRSINVDGKKTTNNEWGSSTRVFNNDNDQVYVYSDEDNLYLYVTGNNIKNYSNYKVSIAYNINGDNYKYTFNNGVLSDSITDRTINSNIEYYVNEGLELEIPLEDININHYSDIYGIKVELDSYNYNFVIIHDGVQSMIIDGENSHVYEYHDSLVYNDTIDKVYLHNDEEYSYIYTSTDCTNSAMDIYLSTSNNGTNYGYLIRNNTLYKVDDLEIIETIDNNVNKVGSEYKFRKSFIGSDITGMYIRYYNNGEIVKNVVFTINVDSRTMLIDGLISNDSEWNTSDRVYYDLDNGIYLYDDSKYLYIYTVKSSKFNNETIYLRTTGDDYNYYINGNSLYSIDNTVIKEDLLSVINNKNSEYKITMSDLDIESINEINKIKVSYDDNNIEFDVVYPNGKTINVDGYIGGSEWSNDDKQEGYDDLYIYSDGNYYYVGINKTGTSVEIDIIDDKSNSLGDYSYKIANRVLYDKEDNVINDNLSYGISTNIEYKISLNDLGITNNLTSTIYALVVTLDDNTYVYKLNLPVEFIDGFNKGEFTNDDLINTTNVYDDFDTNSVIPLGNVNTYYKVKDNDLYGYINLENSSDVLIGFDIDGDSLLDYIINDGKLYTGSVEDSNLVDSSLIYYNDNGSCIEFKINMEDINITSISDIRITKIELIYDDHRFDWNF